MPVNALSSKQKFNTGIKRNSNTLADCGMRANTNCNLQLPLRRHFCTVKVAKTNFSFHGNAIVSINNWPEFRQSVRYHSNQRLLLAFIMRIRIQNQFNEFLDAQSRCYLIVCFHSERRRRSDVSEMEKRCVSFGLHYLTQCCASLNRCVKRIFWAPNTKRRLKHKMETNSSQVHAYTITEQEATTRERVRERENDFREEE